MHNLVLYDTHELAAAEFCHAVDMRHIQITKTNICPSVVTMYNKRAKWV